MGAILQPYAYEQKATYWARIAALRIVDAPPKGFIYLQQWARDNNVKMGTACSWCKRGHIPAVRVLNPKGWYWVPADHPVPELRVARGKERCLRLICLSDLHERVKAQAKKQGIYVSQYIRRAIRAQLKKDES